MKRSINDDVTVSGALAVSRQSDGCCIMTKWIVSWWKSIYFYLIWTGRTESQIEKTLLSQTNIVIFENSKYGEQINKRLIVFNCTVKLTLIMFCYWLHLLEYIVLLYVTKSPMWCSYRMCAHLSLWGPLWAPRPFQVLISFWALRLGFRDGVIIRFGLRVCACSCDH